MVKEASPNRIPLRMVVVCILLCAVLWSVGAAEVPILRNSNDLLAATVPIIYGEASFRERILDRTGGERDPVGLVLSGGSARAFAHIGVLRFIEEQGIVPDFIISNSMGSIVGLLYAAGLSPDQIFSVCSKLDISQLFDLSLPLAGGFLDTSRFSSLVAAYLGENLRLEDLPIPVMIVGEDLVTKRQVRIMEGDALTVFEAAFALPVYFPPVNYRGHLLVDGGMTNLVPLDIAYDYTDTTIVSTTFYEGKNVNLRNALSVLNISIDLAKRREGVASLQQHPDTIWIRCDVEDFSFMDFDAIDELTDLGYRSASRHAAALDALEAEGPDQEIEAFRTSFETHMDRVLDEYALFNRVRQHHLSQQMFLGLHSFEYGGDSWYLREDSILGLMYDLRWKRLWFSLHAGMGWDSRYPMDVYPGIAGRISLQPLSPLLLEADFVVTSDDDIIPSLFHRLNLLLRHDFAEGAIRTSVDLRWEHQWDSSFTLDSMLVHTGLALDWTSEGRIHVEGAWQLAGDWDRQFLHTNVIGMIPFADDFRWHMGYTGRYSLDGAGNVPLYSSDGFRSAKDTLVSTAPFLVVGNLGVDWKPAWFKPTAGELLIFNESSIGLFGDFLWNESNSFLPQVSIGTILSTKVSLLGLNSLPTSLYVGYDGPSKGILWGIVFGRRL